MMNEQDFEQFLLDVSRIKDPTMIMDIADQTEAAAVKRRKERILEYKDQGLSALQCLKEIKKQIAWAGGKTNDFMDNNIGKTDDIDVYLAKQAKEEFKRAKKNIEEVYNVKFRKKRRKR